MTERQLSHAGVCRLPARLKLVRFPPHSPLPIAALPSMSLPSKLHSLDRDVFYVASPLRSMHPSAFASFKMSILETRVI